MATVTVNDSNLYDIADSIRAKLGVQTTYKPSEMANAIDSISGGGITPTGTVSITQNGTTDVTNYANASVSVPNSYSASDEGKVVSNGALVSQSSDTITENGTYDTTLLNSITINVEGGDMWSEEIVTTSGAVTKALDPRVLYHFTGDLTSLTVTLNAAEQGSIAIYHLDFECGSTVPTITMPNGVVMPDNLIYEANRRYEVDILNNYGVVVSWAISS